MPALTANLRAELERAVIAARDHAESAARTALGTLDVERAEPFPTMNEDQKRLRRAPRAAKQPARDRLVEARYRELDALQSTEKW